MVWHCFAGFRLLWTWFGMVLGGLGMVWECWAWFGDALDWFVWFRLLWEWFGVVADGLGLVWDCF